MEEVVHVPEVVLNSGYKMPVLGMGTATYPMPRLDELPSILVDAIEAGYRHFDTAALYGSEEALGRADLNYAGLDQTCTSTSSSAPKTHKLEIIDLHLLATNTEENPLFIVLIEDLRRKLGLDFVDLYVIHWPTSKKPGPVDILKVKKEDVVPFDMKGVTFCGLSSRIALIAKGSVEGDLCNAVGDRPTTNFEDFAKKKKKNTGYINAKKKNQKQKEKSNNIPRISQVRTSAIGASYISSIRTSATGPSTNKRKRGVTQMQAVHGRTDRQLIVLNRLNQPIGPTKAVVTEFSSFLGTLARNGEFCPLNLSWTKLKTHDDMWSYIQEKYEVSNNGKNWAMRSIDAAFRGHKSRLKNRHFYAYTNDEIRRAKRPTSIPEPVFEDLLKYWHSEEAEIQSAGLDFVPLRNVHIVYVPDEEVGGFDGMKKVVELKEFEELNVGFMMDGQASTNN
ncbi:hypothetical protein FXO38_13338 [Capsicum annuum]|nr:hypothetical protein FXO38_13338 [Capsicum annuum]